MLFVPPSIPFMVPEAEAQSAFTTNNMVISVGAGEITCMGFDYLPSGTQSVWLLGPAQEFADITDGKLMPEGLYRNIVENSQWLAEVPTSPAHLIFLIHQMVTLLQTHQVNVFTTAWRLLLESTSLLHLLFLNQTQLTDKTVKPGFLVASLDIPLH